MVVGVFPAAKLGALLLKQISKPIANAVKEQAKSSPVFRTYVCMPPAQFYNWCEIKAKMWILNLGKPVNIPVLNESMAIELGANLLGEGLIFLIAAGLLLAEYNRSSRKETAKEAARVEEMTALTHSLRELFFKTEEQSTQIRELSRMIYDLESRVVHKPWVPKSPPSSTEPAIASSQTHESNKNVKQPTSFIPESFKDEAPLGPYTLSMDTNSSNVILEAVEVANSLWSENSSDIEIGIVTVALNYVVSRCQS